MNELKKERQQKGLTQKEAAKAIGISYSMLTKLENNDRYASMETMKKIADFYKKSVDNLFFNH